MTESTSPELDRINAEWFKQADWRPLTEYESGPKLFRTEGGQIFYGEIRGPSVIQFLDTEVGDERDWRGGSPVEFTDPPEGIAAIYMML